jgi:hypothetical protein
VQVGRRQLTLGQRRSPHTVAGAGRRFGRDRSRGN